MLSQPQILVATDFSPSSDLALKAAEKIRKLTGGRIHAIHVTPFPGELEGFAVDLAVNYYPSEYHQVMIDALRKRILEQIERNGVTATGEVLTGPTADTILSSSTTFHADLLIIGHKGRGKHFRFGGVAAKVTSGTDRPVLVVNREFDVKKVAGLVDPFTPEKKIFAATEELAFVCSGNAEFVSLWPDQTVYVEESFPEGGISVVRMNEEKKREVKERMENVLRSQADPHTKAIIHAEVGDENKIRDGLVRILDEDHVDLAVMSKHHQGKLEKFFLGSMTRGVLDRWTGNLMVLPS